jgi:2-aminomuconate deaminase
MAENNNALATPRANYPHALAAGPFVFVSGTSARQQDNTVPGVEGDPLGTMTLDIRIQTRAVLEQIKATLSGFDLGLNDLVQVTTYLVNMNDFAAYNEVWNQVFPSGGPTRTTIAVRQLPRADLALEMQAVAYRQPGNA